LCLDADIVRRYVARLAESGLRGKLHLLVGVAPLVSAKSARWIKSHLVGSIIPDRFVERLDRARDPAAEGRAICIDFVKELREIAGVGGAHIMAPLNEAAIVEVIAALRAV
jgi:methylenetetrahydrofolate reductase (NADPH)